MDSQFFHSSFQLTESFQPHYDTRVILVCNGNECQEPPWGTTHKADNLTAICRQLSRKCGIFFNVSRPYWRPQLIKR
jgi:hypothetical protein